MSSFDIYQRGIGLFSKLQTLKLLDFLMSSHVICHQPYVLFVPSLKTNTCKVKYLNI